MRLYFAPGACSLSPHIVLREAAVPFELELVSLNTHKTKDGRNFYDVNPKGYVPVLELDDGQIVTEGPVIVQYVADLLGDTKLLPPAGSFERVRVQEWLNFVGTELHKAFSPLFAKTTPDEYRAATKEKIAKRLDYVATQLGEKPYLMGDTFTVADAYLFTVLRWTFSMKIDLPEVLAEYVARVSARPKVRETLDVERLDIPAHATK
jgi:glutathione S-transferase